MWYSRARQRQAAAQQSAAGSIRTARGPAAGIGKPEPLRHVLAGAWSRRISEEHRLVYLVDGPDLVVLQARFHDK
jgi:Txe/YoeB family toxin of toxin-antitoxin system